MEAINEINDTYNASFVGYSKSKKYRVNVQEIEADKNTVFTYFAEMEDLREVVKSYVADLSNEEDFQIFLKLRNETENGISIIDCRVVVSFENSTHLFYPPAPEFIYIREGRYIISTEECYDIRVAYTMVIYEEDYQIKILELFESVVDKDENASLEAPTAILYLSFDPEINLWEAFPLKVSITYEPRSAFTDADIAQKDHVLQFRGFVDSLTEQGELLEEKISKKKW